jgi:hypothetical protein
LRDCQRKRKAAAGGAILGNGRAGPVNAGDLQVPGLRERRDVKPGRNAKRIGGHHFVMVEMDNIVPV